MDAVRRIGLSRAVNILMMAFLVVACASAPPDEATGTTEGSADALVGVPGTGLPSGVPNGYLATPAGYMHPSCLHHIARGETIAADGSIQGANGSVRARPSCGFARYDMKGNIVQQQGAAPTALVHPSPPTNNTGSTDKAKIDGWSLAANASYQPAVKGLSVNWTVPPVPPRVSGQILFFFPGTEPLDNGPNATILQPVLGFENGGGAWAVQSWNCCVDGTAMYSDKYDVNPGDTIQGTMTGSNCDSGSGLCQNWQIVTKDLNNGRASVMNTTPFNHPQRWIFGAVLEAYGLSSCDMLPATRKLDWHNFSITAMDGSHPTLSWHDDIDATLAGCGIWGSSQTSNGSDFTLYFGASSTAGGAGMGGTGSSGNVRLVNPNSQKCLDVNAAATADGTKIQLWTCNGTGAQSFQVQPVNGAYQIVNTNSGKCVDIQSSGTADGTQVQLWPCNGTGAQLFRIGNTSGGQTTLVNTNSNACVDVNAAGTADGTKVQLWGCNNTVAQNWVIQGI